MPIHRGPHLELELRSTAALPLSEMGSEISEEPAFPLRYPLCRLEDCLLGSQMAQCLQTARGSVESDFVVDTLKLKVLESVKNLSSVSHARVFTRPRLGASTEQDT